MKKSKALLSLITLPLGIWCLLAFSQILIANWITSLYETTTLSVTVNNQCSQSISLIQVGSIDADELLFPDCSSTFRLKLQHSEEYFTIKIMDNSGQLFERCISTVSPTDYNSLSVTLRDFNDSNRIGINIYLDQPQRGD